MELWNVEDPPLEEWKNAILIEAGHQRTWT
jgi:hypothetical protein